MQEERKKILQMVKNGELTIDEAEKLLEELEKIHRRKEKIEKVIAKEISPDVDFEDERDYKKGKEETIFGDKMESTKEKLFGFIESALNKLKEMDLDFHHSVDVSQTLQKSFNEFETIYVEIPNGSLHLMPWDHTDIRVECNARVYREESIEEGKKRLLKELDFDVRNNRLLLCCNEKFLRLHAKMYIPKQTLEKVQVKLFNGPITIENLDVGTMDVKTMNGKIEMNRCKAEKGEVETANGTISVFEGNFRELEVETVSGRLDVSGIFEKLDASTLSGAVYVSVKNEDADTIRTASATGNIYIQVPEDVAAIGEVKSNLGHVEVKLPNLRMMEEKSEIIQKLLKFEKEGTIGKKMYIFADTKTGSVSVRSL